MRSWRACNATLGFGTVLFERPALAVWVCVGGAQVDGDTITVSLGETATCTITNDDIPRLQGCTPGFWQGGDGRGLWDVADDLDWTLSGDNPFTHATPFNGFFAPVASLTGLSMWDLVSTGGGPDPARKAARSLVAAYLNASHAGVSYPYGTTLLEQWWSEAATGIDSADDGTDVMTFALLHTTLDAANNLGCSIDSSATATATAGAWIFLLPLAAFAGEYLRRRGRHEREERLAA